MRADGSRNGLVQDQVDRSCVETAEPCIGGQMVWEGQWELILHHWVHGSYSPPLTRPQATWSDVEISHVSLLMALVSPQRAARPTPRLCPPVPMCRPLVG